MKRKIGLQFVFSVLCFFLCITSTYADECTNKELRELKQLASKIEVSYELGSKDDNYYFSFYAYNMNNKMYVDNKGIEHINYNKQKKQYLFSYAGGSQLEIFVRANLKTNCADYKLATFKVILPFYNKYSTKEECSLYPEFELCKKWKDTSKISEDEFENKLNKYNDSLNIVDNNILDDILGFIIKYKMYFIYSIIFVFGAVILAKIVRRKNKVKIEL